MALARRAGRLLGAGNIGLLPPCDGVHFVRVELGTQVYSSGNARIHIPVYAVGAPAGLQMDGSRTGWGVGEDRDGCRREL